MTYQFIFHLEPESHSDATMFTKAGAAYTPQKKKDYQSRCINSFQAKEKYDLPLTGPLIALWIFFLPRTKHLTRSNVEQNLYHHTKPDGDGLVKVIQDLIQTGDVSHKAKRTRPRLGIIVNDSQITLTCIEKTYCKLDQKPHIKLVLCKPTQRAPLMRLILQALVS